MGNKKKAMGPLIILHGWSFSRDKWGPFLSLLDEKGMEYKMLKIPGLTAPLARAWTLEDYVSFLRRMTRSEEQIALFGHSNGGRIAAAFTSQYPERVSKLVLIDSAGIVRRDLKTKLKKSLFVVLAKIGKKITTQESIRNLFYKVVGEKDYNMADPILKKTMINLISHDLEPIFSRIKIPTLIIWGRQDKTTPLSDGRKIHSLIGKSRLEIIEGARHSPQFTHPGEVIDLVDNFLKDEYL